MTMTAQRPVNKTMVLVATGFGLFLIYLDATIVNVALPDIQDHFGGGEGALQWVPAAYTLTMGMFMMTVASLADDRGRKRVFLGGVLVFALGSLLCAVAPSLVVLTGARALQGVGAATVNVASLALVSAAYPDPRAKAKAIGIWTGIAAVGLAIGPTLGGVLTESVGWRSIFAVNVVMAVVAFVLVWHFVSESRASVKRSFDLPGQLLFIVGIGVLTYALIQAPQEGWLSPVIVGAFVVAALFVVVFIVTELRVREPMMDVRVFNDGVYTAAIVTIFILLFGVYGSFLVVTQYFQNILGFGPEKAGFLMLANTIPTIILAPIAGRIAAKRGGRRPTLAGMVAAIAGMALIGLGAPVALWIVLVGLALLGAGGGLAIAPATNVAMSSIPEERAGMASGIMSAQRALGSTAGFAIMGSILAVVVAGQLPADLAATVPDARDRAVVVEHIVADANPQGAIGLIGPGRLLPDPGGRVYVDEVVDAADDAFTSGIRMAQLVAAALGLGALVFGWIKFPRGVLARVEEAEAGKIARDTDPEGLSTL